MTPTTNPLTPEATENSDESRALERRRMRRATERAYRFVDEHPLVAFGAALFTGTLMGRLSRGSSGEHSFGAAAADLVGTAARAAIRATAVSLITRKIASALADEESHHTTH